MFIILKPDPNRPVDCLSTVNDYKQSYTFGAYYTSDAQSFHLLRTSATK